MSLMFPFTHFRDDSDPDWDPTELSEADHGEVEEQPGPSTQTTPSTSAPTRLSVRVREEEGEKDGSNGSGDNGSGEGRGRGHDPGRSHGLPHCRCRGRGRGRGNGGQEEDDQDGAGWLGTDSPDILPTQPIFKPARTPGAQLLTGTLYRPLELFQKFVCMSTLHVTQQQPVDLADMYCFIAILIYMGIVHLPAITDYWRKSQLYSLPYPSVYMSCRRFQMISTAIHIATQQMMP